MHPEINKIWQEREVVGFFLHLLAQTEELATSAIASKGGTAAINAISLMSILANYYNEDPARPLATMGHLLATVELATEPQLRYLVGARAFVGRGNKADLPFIQHTARTLAADLAIGEQERAVIRRYLAALPLA